MAIYVVLGFLLVLVLVKLCAQRGRFARRARLPPGSMGWPIVGETLELIAAHKTPNPEPFAESRRARYGPVFKTHLLGKPTIFSTDVEVNKFVLHNEGRLFASSYPRSLVSLLGKNSLLLTGGPRHKQLYSLIWSFTSSNVLKDYLMAEVEAVICSVLSTWASSDGQAQKVVYVQDEAKKITFNLSVSQQFSVSVDPQWTEALRKEYLLLVEGFFSLPISLPGTTYGRALQARVEIAKKIKAVVEQRRAHQDGHGRREYHDLLAAILSQNMTDEQIVDMVISLLVAGYETTSMIITLAVKFLTDHPAALRQLQAEHNTIKDGKKAGEKLFWGDIKSMTFTQCVINETLRMGNMVGGVFRKALQDVDVQGFTIPKGWTVFASFRAIHFDEANYRDAQVFNPWRWLECNTTSNFNYKFTPFGGGPRFCPGHELAKVEISMFLYYLTTQFSWEAVEKDELIFFPTTRMVKRLPVTVRSLSKADTLN